MTTYILETWPDVQYYMDEPDFNEHACLADDEYFVKKYGNSAYFIEKEWAEKVRSYEEDIDNIAREIEDMQYVGNLGV